MEVILREHVDNLGRRGEIVKVADGYARNYLLPRKLALPATDGNKKQIERERRSSRRAKPRSRSAAEAMAERLAQRRDRDRPPGRRDRGAVRSVTTADIAEALAAKGFEIDRASSQLAEPIKKLGEYDVPVKLHRDVTAQRQGQGRRRRRAAESSSTRRRSASRDHGRRRDRFSGRVRSGLTSSSAPAHARHGRRRRRRTHAAAQSRSRAVGARRDPAAQRRVQPRRRGDRLERFLPRRAPPHLRQDGQAGRARRRDRSRHAEGGARRGRASSTRSAARPTSRRSSTACRARPTSSTTRGSSRRRRRSGT